MAVLQLVNILASQRGHRHSVVYRSGRMVDHIVMALHRYLNYRVVACRRAHRLDWVAQGVGGQQAGEGFENRTYSLGAISAARVIGNVSTW